MHFSSGSQSDKPYFHSPYGFCQYVWNGRKRRGIHGNGRGKTQKSKEHYRIYHLCQFSSRHHNCSYFICIYVPTMLPIIASLLAPSARTTKLAAADQMIKGAPQAM